MYKREGEGNDSGDVQTAKILRGLLHMRRMCQELGNVIFSTLSFMIRKRKQLSKLSSAGLSKLLVE